MEHSDWITIGIFLASNLLLFTVTFLKVRWDVDSIKKVLGNGLLDKVDKIQTRTGTIESEQRSQLKHFHSAMSANRDNITAIRKDITKLDDNIQELTKEVYLGKGCKSNQQTAFQWQEEPIQGPGIQGG